MFRFAVIAGLCIAASASAQQYTSQFPLEATHFSPFGGHPHFFLNPGHRLVYAGEDAGDQIVLTVTALNQTKQITLPSGGQPRAISTRVVEEREVVNGELAQVARLWYARGIETGDVYFFGEEVDYYSGGVIVGQALLWQAGVGGAQPGLMMPRTFLLGARYYQCQAAAALDGAENFAMGLTVTVPAGTFSNCVQIRELDALRPEEGTADKTYAPGIGLVNDDDILLLTEFRLGTLGLPGGGSFTPFSDHPFLPFSPGRCLVLTGTENNQTVFLTNTVLNEIRTIPLSILGESKQIPARVIEERRIADGQLVEVSRHFLAQCLETGDVHYFGKEVDRYSGGVVVGHEGSWLAGVGGAEAGIFMPANFAVGARYYQQNAPGIANDLAVNSATGVTQTTPAGTFSNCARVTVTGSIGTNTAPRELNYSPGIGLVSDRNVLRLVSFTNPGVSGAPVLSIQEAVLLTWPLTDNLPVLQSSSNLVNWLPVLQPSTFLNGRNQISLPRDQSRSYFRLTVP